ncbi:polyketide synthase dehydratase domain-containing protein, partial [Streptomyces iakyrus]|uniref:polyketide synthase dehydratase domain-containing protein n=1 Tax=Streptomyces iakyrus TaxID=68219 RepID=UPI003681C7FF
HPDETHTHLTTLTTLHTHHHHVDLAPHLLSTPHHLDLPTYPFQHQPYWLQAPAQLTDATDLGMATSAHPLLAATVQLAGTERRTDAAEASSASTVFTGRIGLGSHSWLGDHAVSGTVLLPGTALVDLALHAGDHTGGATHLDELTLHAPLVLDETTSRDLQVTTTPGSDADSWRVTIHSRPHITQDDDTEPWTCHATGTLTTTHEQAQPLTHWPPTAATPLDTADLYERLTAAGYEYGPAFQGVTSLWEQPDGTLLAEIALPDTVDPAGHAIHPALLDAALHPLAAQALASAAADELRLPFAWTGVTVHATGATHLRVALTSTGNDVSVQAWDPMGAPVATVAALASRPVDPTALGTGPGNETRNSLFHLVWKPVEAVTGEVDLDRVDLYLPDVGGADGADGADDLGVRGDGPAKAHTATEALLSHLQSWLAANETTDRNLVILTRHAVATSPAEDVHLPHAPLWGLVRSAQNENPGRIHLIDTDDLADTSYLADALATGEYQLAVRHLQVLAPRLARSADGVDGGLTIPDDPNWRLDKTAPGTLDNLALLPNPELPDELAAGQVRIDVRAIGLNFRDVLITLGMYPGDALLASEGAGIVTEVADDVTGVSVGDRVMGMFPLGVGAQTVTDHRLVTAVPEGWDFTTAAGVPVAFLTAYYALYDLADLQPGETLLLHAATGGVGSAALQLAQHTGAD